MALSKKRRPLALLMGEVIAIEAKPEYNREGKQTGNTGRYDVTLLQASHATPDIRFPLGADAPRVPEKGEHVALIVDCGESDEYGANFRALRYVSEDDIQNVVAYLPVAAGK